MQIPIDLSSCPDVARAVRRISGEQINAAWTRCVIPSASIKPKCELFNKMPVGFCAIGTRMLASAVGCAQTKIVIPLVTMDTSVRRYARQCVGSVGPCRVTAYHTNTVLGIYVRYTKLRQSMRQDFWVASRPHCKIFGIKFGSTSLRLAIPRQQDLTH